MADTKISAAQNTAVPLKADMIPFARANDPTARSFTVLTLRAGIYNVQDYGAVGDGVTDDSTAVQAASDAAAAASSSNGRATVYVPPGIYRINTPITLGSNVVYDFRNATFQPGAGCSGLYEFYASGKSHFTVVGGSYIQGPYAATTVLNGVTYTNHVIFQIVGGCQYFDISGGYFTNVFGAINVYDCTDGAVHDNYTLQCDASIAVQSTSAAVAATARIWVYNNSIRTGGDDGIVFTPTNTNYDCADCWCFGNYIEKTGLAFSAAVGIRAGHYGTGTGVVRRLHILSNNMKDMTSYGIYIHDLYDSEVSFNIMDGYGTVANGGWAIGLTSHPVVRLKVIGNHLLNPTASKGAGMYTSNLTYVEFASNRVDSYFGSIGSIYLENSSLCDIHDNELVNSDPVAGPAIQSAVGSDNLNVYDNLVVGGVGAAISLTGSNNRIGRNRGYMSENSGKSGAIATGGVIAHGLVNTPASVSVTAAAAGVTDLTVAVDTVNITVTYGGGGNNAFFWRASLAGSL